jgi:hypothetical protein
MLPRSQRSSCSSTPTQPKTVRSFRRKQYTESSFAMRCPFSKMIRQVFY